MSDVGQGFCCSHSLREDILTVSTFRQPRLKLVDCSSCYKPGRIFFSKKRNFCDWLTVRKIWYRLSTECLWITWWFLVNPKNKQKQTDESDFLPLSWRNRTNFLQNELSTKFRWLSRCLFSNTFFLLFFAPFFPWQKKTKAKRKNVNPLCPKKSGKKKSPWRCLAKKMKKTSGKKIWKQKLGKNLRDKNSPNIWLVFRAHAQVIMAVQALASIRELAVNWPYPVRSSSLGRWENFFLGEVVFLEKVLWLAGTFCLEDVFFRSFWSLRFF